MDLSNTLHINIDPRKAESGSRRATAALDKVKRGAEKTTSSMGRLTKSLAYVGGAYALLRAASYAKDLADSYTNLNNRLRLVTKSEEEAIHVRKELFKIADRTRNSLSATGLLYARISLGANDLTHSQEDLLRVTEILNKQVLIGGNNLMEARAGLIQFAQGIASGRLQGDELRSVMENLLGVQAGLIRGFKLLEQEGKIDFEVTKANIRELAGSGILTSNLLLEALLRVGDETDATFSKIQFTVAQSIQRMGNKLLEYVGELDVASGSSKALSQVLNIIAENLKSVIGNVTQGAATWVIWNIATSKVVTGLFAITSATTTTTAGIIGLGGSITRATVRVTIFTKVMKGAAAAMVLFKRAIPFAGVFLAIEAAMWSYQKVTKEVVSDTDDVTEGLETLNSRMQDLITDSKRFAGELAGVEEGIKRLKLLKGLELRVKLDVGRDQLDKDVAYVTELLTKTAKRYNSFGNGSLGNIGFNDEASKNKLKDKMMQELQVLGELMDKYKEYDKLQAKLYASSGLPPPKKEEFVVGSNGRYADNDPGLRTFQDIDRSAFQMLDELLEEEEKAKTALLERLRSSEISQIQDTFEQKRAIAQQHHTEQLKLLEDTEDENGKTAKRITAIYKNELAIIAENEREHNEELAEKRLNDATDWQSGYKRAMNNLTKETTDFASISENAVTNFADGFADAFVRMAETGKLSFKGLAASIISDLLRIHAKAVALSLLQTIFSAFSGPPAAAHSTNPAVIGEHFGISPGGEQAIDMAAQGFRATGGNVRSNIPVVVGEQGREIFTPNQSGRIIPNHALPTSNTQARQSPNIEMNISIDASGSEAVDVRIQQAAETTFKRAVAEVMERAESGGYESIALGVR